MIIGISGKKTSGKDTVGKIIQLLVAKSPERELIEFVKNDLTIIDNEWEIKKFADKLKDIVALLIGCTKEQLEDEEFKNTELGEEWWFYKWGEDIYTLTELYLLEEDYLNYYNEKLSEKVKLKILVKPTPRFLLQNIGTDLFRNQLHPNIWVNSLMSEYKPKDTLRTKEKGLFQGNIEKELERTTMVKLVKNKSNWIVTDLRFPNELKAVENKGGITIRVNRVKKLSKKYIGEDGLVSTQVIELDFSNQHISETALDDAKFDYVIDNNGTIEELIEKVKEILIKEQII